MDTKIVVHDRLGYRISTQYSDQFFYKQIKSDLTLSSVDYHTQELVNSIYYYETEKALLVPRFFPIQDYVNNSSIEKQEEWKSKKIKIKSKIVPRNDIQKDSIDYLMTHPHSLLQLDPGSGKTIIAIDVLCKIKYKTIIFVHRDSLMEQWRDRLKSFTNIIDNKIGVLSTKSYEYVLNNCDIILSSVQAFNAILRNKNHIKNFQKLLYHSGIGLMIGDEVHTTIGAPKFSIASMFIPCHRTIGLSATPDREDGTFKIIKYHLGEVYESKFDSETMNAAVDVILFNFELLKGRERWLFWEGKFQYGRYYQILKNSTIFRQVLNNIITQMINDNRNIVLMAERLKLLDKLMIEFSDYDVVAFTSGIKNDCLSHKIVFTTPGKMRDGVDAPWKDTLIMTSPIKNINQATGRIIRTYIDKKDPLIIDIVDTGIKNIKSTFRKTRLPFYNKKGWEVRFFAFDETGYLNEMDKDNAYQLSGMK